jgi:hypothetical protein
MSHPRDLRVPAEEVLPIVDARLYLGLFEERFGVPAETFRDYSFFKANAQAIWVVRRDLLVPARPKPYAVGMPFYYYRMIHPRPTTPAVLRWGHLATRHLADLDADQVGLFIDYQDVPQNKEQEAAFSRGYWLMRFRGRLLGVGLATTDDAERPIFRALTPKFWRLRLDQLTGDDGDDGMEE